MNNDNDPSLEIAKQWLEFLLAEVKLKKFLKKTFLTIYQKIKKNLVTIQDLELMENLICHIIQTLYLEKV